MTTLDVSDLTASELELIKTNFNLRSCSTSCKDGRPV